MIWPFYALQQAIQLPAQGVETLNHFSMTLVLFFSVIQYVPIRHHCHLIVGNRVHLVPSAL